MKKVFTVIAVAALTVLFCGCNKENVSTDKQALTVNVSMPDDEIATKTALDGTTLTWATTDRLYVAAAHKGLSLWRLNRFDIDPATIRNSGKTASFVDMSGKDWTGAEKFCVVYGSVGANSVIANRDGGWWVAGTSPADGSDQNYFALKNACWQVYAAGGPRPQYLAMYSDVVSNLDDVQFRNLMSIIKLPVKTSGAAHTLSSIKVVCSGVSISGQFGTYRHTNSILTLGGPKEFSLSYGNSTSDTPIAEDFSTGSRGNWVLLKDINVPLTSTDQYFYLVVFPGSHGTLTFTLTDTASNTKVITWDTAFTSQSGKIYNFPSVDWNS